MNNLSSNLPDDGPLVWGHEDPAMTTGAVHDSDLREASAAAATMSAEDQRLHDVGVAALTAVSQYPHAINEDSNSLLVSEVVRAVTGSTLVSPRPGSPVLKTDGESPLGAEQPYSAHSDSETFSSESQATDDDVDMQNIWHDLLQHAAAWNQIATATEDDDYGNVHKDIVMDYEPTLDEEYASPSSGPDDDLEDLLRFYPGEEEYYRQRNMPHSPESTMDDINLDEFYNNLTYESPNVNMPQTPGPDIPPEGPLTADTAHQIGASIIHTTSMFPWNFG